MVKEINTSENYTVLMFQLDLEFLKNCQKWSITNVILKVWQS